MQPWMDHDDCICIVIQKFARMGCFLRASLVAQAVKNPPAMQETHEVWFQYLGQEDPLEEEMTAHSSILVRKIPWTEEFGGLQSMGSQRVGQD